jgi:hypothetical protein
VQRARRHYEKQGRCLYNEDGVRALVTALSD